MLNRRRLLLTGAATLSGGTLVTVAEARSAKPKPKWQWKTVTRTSKSTQPIAIPDEGIATPYGAKIRVSGMRQGSIRKITVALSGLTHTWPRDLDIMLVNPKGRGVILMNDAGGENEINVNLTFDDTAPTKVPEEPETLLSGKYQPTTYAGDNGTFPPPRPRATGGRPWPCSRTATRMATGHFTWWTTATPKQAVSLAGH